MADLELVQDFVNSAAFEEQRDDLQDVIAKLKEADFGIALQFNNFRD